MVPARSLIRIHLTFMTKGIVVGFVVIVLLALGYVLLGNTAQNEGQPYTIALNPYPGDGIFFIAQEKGFFKKYGVNVKIINTTPDNLAQMLASDQAQMLYQSVDFISVLADSGIDAKLVFVPSMSDGADGVVVSKNIKDITDLKGKKVYLGLGFPSHFLFRYVAAEHGLKTSDIQIVNMNPEDVGAAFVSGKINAGVTWEPWLSRTSERADGKVLFTSKDVPGVILDAAIVRGNTIKNRRADTENAMRAAFDAVQWWNEHPEEGNAIAAKGLDQKVDEFAPTKATVKLLTLEDNLKKFDKSTLLNVYYLAEHAATIYHEDGVIKAQMTGDTLVDESLLQELR